MKPAQNYDESSDHSVTRMIKKIKKGDPDAASEFWHRYLPRLLRLAQQKMKFTHRQVADEEDVMVSVFNRFLVKAAEGKFKKLDDRTDLWFLLVMLTERKIISHHRFYNEAKVRGAGKVVNQVDLNADADPEQVHSILEELAKEELTPEYIVQFNELYEKALDSLEGIHLAREVAEALLSGSNNREIAEKLNVSVKTVERKKKVIREIWREVFADYFIDEE